jgi:flagellar FliL protein
MAEAATSTEIEGKKKSFGKILFLGLSAILFLTGIGFFLLTKFGVLVPSPSADTKVEADAPQQIAAHTAPEAHTGPADHTTAPSATHVAAEGESALVELKPFVVNLQDEHRSRYLRLAIQLEIVGAKWEDEIQKRLPQVRNRLLFLLSNKTVDDISSVDGKYRLQEEIVQHVNETLEKAIVQKAYFTDFIVQ